MASPFTIYFAGVGTVVAALAIGFGGALVLTSPSPSEKEQKSAYEKRVDAAREKPVVIANPEPARPKEASRPDIFDPVPVSPILSAAMAPTVSTTFSPPLPSAPWPGSPAQDAQRAPDPGMLQPVVRPATPPVEAAAPPPLVADQPAAKPRETQRTERVIEPANQWKKKERREQIAQKKPRKQNVEPVTVGQAVPEDDVIETRTVTTYEPERPRAPLGIFNMLLGGTE